MTSPRRDKLRRGHDPSVFHDDRQPGESSAYRWVVLGLVMMGTFMAILDSSIVNVALPHMMSAFGVNRDQIEWVTTAFMLATAVAMPLVGWLVTRLGLKALYLGSLAIFTAGSALCALAWNYDVMIGARVVQALGGGAIQPVGMAIVADLFAPRERGRALGIWGTGIMVGPALGPTLGGYLTDWFNWRVIFSVNLPLGVITLLVGLIYMHGERHQDRPRLPLDVWGFLFVSLAMTAGLLALSNGQTWGWHSSAVRLCFGLSIVGLVLFLATEMSVPHPLLPLSLFRIPNFSLAMILAVFRAVGLFGGVFLMPIFLERLVGYTTIQTGLWLMPGAVTVGLMMPVAGRLADRYDPNWLVALGSLATGVSLLMFGWLDPLSGSAVIIGPQVLRGLGLALMMAPLLSTAINSVPPTLVATASSFLNVGQRLGGSFGIAFLNTMVTNAIHRHAVRLGESLPRASVAYQHLAHHVARASTTGPSSITGPRGTALAAAQSIFHRASVLGFENGFVIAGLILLLGLPLCFFLQPARGGPSPRRPRSPARSRRTRQAAAPAPCRSR